MKAAGKPRVPPEKQLRILAREFRSTRDGHRRAAIAGEYAEAVKQLIDSNRWKRIPPLEDQLPDEWMPETFFAFWSLSPPIRRSDRVG
jgi:hypothetical protein